MARSTINKLNKSLINSKEIDNLDRQIKAKPIIEEKSINLEIFGELSCYIGKVKYFNEKQISDYLKSGKFLEENSVNTVLFKRTEFHEEQEIRLICWIKTDYQDVHYEGEQETFSYSIDPNELFDELIFDSRISDERFEALSSYIKSLGFKNHITKSTLYDVPKRIVIVR